MHARNLTIAAAVLTLAVGTVVAANAGNDTPASEQLEETSSLYAYAVQPNDCTPGYVQINHARGATWSIGGEHVDVDGPSSRFDFPGGLQDDVTAGALPGYRIAGNVQSTFYVTVNAVPPRCYDEPATDPKPDPTPTADPGTPATDDTDTPPATDPGTPDSNHGDGTGNLGPDAPAPSNCDS
jgi:hypothetical protein